MQPGAKCMRWYAICVNKCRNFGLPKCTAVVQMRPFSSLVFATALDIFSWIMMCESTITRLHNVCPVIAETPLQCSRQTNAISILQRISREAAVTCRSMATEAAGLWSARELLYGMYYRLICVKSAVKTQPTIKPNRPTNQPCYHLVLQYIECCRVSCFVSCSAAVVTVAVQARKCG